MTADELAKCKRAWETIREMENPARQSIAVALWTGLYAEELLQAAGTSSDLYETLNEAINYVALHVGRTGDEKANSFCDKCAAVLAHARGEQP